MKTVYLSSDGKQFGSRRKCKLYEDALIEKDKIDHLQYEEVGGVKFYKINTMAELYFFDHLGDTPQKKSSKTLYDIFQDLEDKNFRFPIWVKEDGTGSKSSEIKKMELRIETLQNEINSIKEDIDLLNSLDSRKKTPVTETEDEGVEEDSETTENLEVEKENNEV